MKHSPGGELGFGDARLRAEDQQALDKFQSPGGELGFGDVSVTPLAELSLRNFSPLAGNWVLVTLAQRQEEAGNAVFQSPGGGCFRNKV